MDSAPKFGSNLTVKLAFKIWLNLRTVLLNLTADKRVLSGLLVKFGCG